MKKVYIVLTYSGTILSNIIKSFTRAEYCHCSISLDKDLKQMYSFGRLNAYNPFIGGFTRESTEFGTFKRFKNTKTAIYSLKVSNRCYKKIVEVIEDYKVNKHKYSYNLLGLITAIFGKRLKRRHHKYCTEFVQDVLDKAEIENNLPKVPKPKDFTKIKDTELIYRGILRKYNKI